MATGNAINANSAGLVRYDGAGTFTGVTTTNHAVLIGAASNGITNLALTNGQLAIGSTGADPTAATLTAGSGITITNGAGSITIAGTTGILAWTEVTGTTQAAAINNGYIANNAGLVTITLPATAALGSIIHVVGKGAGLWRLAANTGQTINFGSQSTTATGSLTATQQFDAIQVLCTTANTTWTCTGVAQGNLTVA